MCKTDQIVSWSQNRKSEMLSDLERFVCVQSGSGNKPGVDRMGRMIKAEMESMGFSCTVQKEQSLGDQIIARSPGWSREARQILITGHMDTVFPADTDFNFFDQKGANCFGPGVADMKGGLVVGIYAIKALTALNRIQNLPLTFIFNSDEEIGSPGSGPLIRKEAQNSQMAFVLEAGGLNGEIVTGRKGNLSARIDTTGQAGHAAFAGKDKASAIHELAHKIIAIEKLNDPENGISANVGTVEGGMGPNTIPEHAQARVDFRFLSAQDARKIQARFQAICAQGTVPGTASTLNIISQRPPMPQTTAHMALFNRIQAIGQAVGVPVESQLRQGVSDANLIADEGTPVIDGLGPVGDRDHSKEEYILTQSLLDRTILLALILDSVESLRTANFII